MSNEDLQQLKALAEKIKSGDYSIDECNKFIDVSGPDTILTLIKSIESLAAPAVANGAADGASVPPAILARTEEIRQTMANPAGIGRATLHYYVEFLLAHIAFTNDASTQQAAPKQSLTDKQCAKIKAQAAKATDDWLESQPEENPQLKADGVFIRNIASAIEAASAPNALLVAALEMAVRQNECDMLMTGEECRKCRAALASVPTAPEAT